MSKYIYKLFSGVLFLILITGCTISYKFNGTVINYDIIKSISVDDFKNEAAMVYAPLQDVMSENLKDTYTRQTRLNLIKANADLEVEGEIIGYDITPMSVQSNALAAETKLSIKIRVRYTNNTNHDEDFERTYTAYRTFDSNQLLTDVQDALIEEITEELCDNIYNDTVANW